MNEVKKVLSLNLEFKKVEPTIHAVGFLYQKKCIFGFFGESMATAIFSKPDLQKRFFG